MSSAATTDRRIGILDAFMRKVQFRGDALIAVLHKAQELFGFLDRPILKHVARTLKLPASRVYGVATFYHLFRLKPQGEHTCEVCLGTACFVKGAQELVDAVEQTAEIHVGETTPDGKLSLVVSRCIGTCSIAPLVVMDEQIVGPISAEMLSTRVQEWMSEHR